MSSLLRSNVTVAAGTAVSRITGLARVAVLGVVLSQGPVTDAYDQANGTPNMIYELLLGGVLSATLVPLFTRLHEDDDSEATSAVISVGVVVLAAITAIAVLAAPLIFRMYTLLTSDEVDAGLYHEAGTLLTRIFLVQIFFYGLNAIGAAVLNARRRFFAAAWAPALSNMVIIGSLLLVPATVNHQIPQLDDIINNDKLRWTLALGATVGIAVMALALLPALARANLRFHFTPEFKHPAVRRLWSLSGWALGYVVANQVAIVVIRNLLRGGSGDEDAYTKAFTWFVLPHGLLAVSIATTFLPELASAIKRNDRQTVLDRSSLGIRLIALVTLPAGFGMFVLRRAIVGAAFQHGKFTAANSLNTSRAIAGFALGLVGFSIYLFVLRIFYAHQDARTPFVINVGENVLNIVFALVFVGRWGLLGLGLAFGLAYLVASLWALQVLALQVARLPVEDRVRQLVAHGPCLARDGRGRVGRRRNGRRQLRLGCRRPGRCLDNRRGRHIRRRADSPAIARARRRSLPVEACGTLFSSGVAFLPMFKVFKKWWKYLGAKFNSSFDKHADPAVQLEQALTEAQAQHRRLKEQAANVIANQKQSELRLNSKMAQLEKLNANARQALMMASDAEKAGDAAKAAQYNGAAETIANQLIQVEKDVEGLKTLVLDSAKASDQAKAAVQQNSRILQEKLAEKNKLLSQLEQAKMQEEMNKAMSQLQETVGDDVPTLSEVQQKIEARYVKAKASSELQESTVESRILEVEQATANVEAHSRLSELRAELGLDAPAAAPAPAVEEPKPAAG